MIDANDHPGRPAGDPDNETLVVLLLESLRLERGETTRGHVLARLSEYLDASDAEEWLEAFAEPAREHVALEGAAEAIPDRIVRWEAEPWLSGDRSCAQALEGLALMAPGHPREVLNVALWRCALRLRPAIRARRRRSRQAAEEWVRARLAEEHRERRRTPTAPVDVASPPPGRSPATSGHRDCADGKETGEGGDDDAHSKPQADAGEERGDA